MSTTDPSDNYSVDSHVASHLSEVGLPLQDDQTANFATPAPPKNPAHEKASDSAAAGQPDQDEPSYLKPIRRQGAPPRPVNSDDVYSDRYQRRGELGRGGWGVVERVLDRQLEREVAVKRIIVPEDVSDEAKQRFLHEAKITSQLQHPGVVPVHELVVGSDQGSTYYVMKLLEGETLRDHIRKLHGTGKHKTADAKTSAPKTRYELIEMVTPLLERFIDVCNAVGYAHERGVIHRDLKPANIMVGGFGETIVVDWGLAVHEYEAEITEHTIAGGAASRVPKSPGFSDTDGTVIGTPAYMSPEQARGEQMDLGASSDIYSLGIILWEIVVGNHPYRGRPVDEILNDVCEAVRPDLMALQPLVPRPLLAIINKALGAQPDDRYATATEFAADVRQFMLGEPVSVHEESTLDKVARWCRRNRSLVVTISSSICVLLVVSLCFGYLINISRNAERSAKLQARSAHEMAFNRMVEARDSADSWLIDLSGSLEFYPGLDPIRHQLVQDGIEQYERIVAIAEHSSNNAELLPSDLKLRSMSDLEYARSHMRLGDLYFLDQQKQKSKANFLKAESMLTALAADLPSEFTGDLSCLDEIGLAEWIRFEQANCSLGMAFHEPARISKSEFRGHRRWLQMFTPDDDELLGVSEHNARSVCEFRRKAVSAAARLEVIAHRYAAASQPVEPTIARLKRAAAWGRWLSLVDEKPGTRRLYQTAQEALARCQTEAGQLDAANDSWEKLVSDMASWTQPDNPRPDQLQALAHARLMKLSQNTKSNGAVEAEYRSAINELNQAWSLSDSDSFYRTNLATAEYSLAHAMIINCEEEHTTEKLDESILLSRRALATYQELLRENVSVDRLRRLAETHFLVSQLLVLRHGEDAKSAEINNMLDEHMRSSDLAFEMIYDHGMLEIKDALAWYDLLLFQINATGSQPDDEINPLQKKLILLDQWLGEKALDSNQSKSFRLLQERTKAVMQSLSQSLSTPNHGSGAGTPE